LLPQQSFLNLQICQGLTPPRLGGSQLSLDLVDLSLQLGRVNDGDDLPFPDEIALLDAYRHYATGNF
jgi:hypothetical protein